VRYDGRAAYCDHCGAELFVPEIHDGNLAALYDEYRAKNGLITPGAIREIMKKYRIGKRPLSLLLGWGEQTVARYVSGQIPSKKYSDLLYELYHDPRRYRETLEKNKDLLPSRLPYEKSLKAVSALLVSDGSYELDNIVSYVIYKSEDITPLTLQKALYYIQGFNYAFYGEYLLADDCEAWAHGPVYREVYHKYSNYRFGRVESVERVDVSAFTDAAKVLMDNVIKYFCCYSGKVLESFTHLEGPWVLARNGLAVGVPSDRIIPKENIGEFFAGVKARYDMASPADIGAYAEDMFVKVRGM
jgi:putative zinc finger/helix-turn-helix YgiT family protein